MLEANNRFAAASVWKILQHFSRLAIKYKQEYGKVLVLIIDNANRLAQTQQGALNLFQDYAKFAADEGTVTVVFVSSEGRVPCYIIGKSIIFVVLFNYYMLIKCYREKLVVKSGPVIEIGDASKKEAL